MGHSIFVLTSTHSGSPPRSTPLVAPAEPGEPTAQFPAQSQTLAADAESLAISSMQCGEVNAELQWEMSRFLAESALLADQKTVACCRRCFAQVLI
jgi:hypothetical protein